MILVLGAPVEAKTRLTTALSGDFQVIDHHHAVRDALAGPHETSAELSQLHELVAEGRRVPDELAIRLLRRAFDDAKDLRRTMLVHFPATLSQATMLHAVLESLGSSVRCVLWLSLSESQLLGHLSTTFDPGTAKIKVASFTEASDPIKNFYSERGLLREIDGTCAADEILLRARRALDR